MNKNMNQERTEMESNLFGGWGGGQGKTRQAQLMYYSFCASSSVQGHLSLYEGHTHQKWYQGEKRLLLKQDGAHQMFVNRAN